MIPRSFSTGRHSSLREQTVIDYLCKHRGATKFSRAMMFRPLREPFGPDEGAKIGWELRG
jgi:hypothetical protein